MAAIVKFDFTDTYQVDPVSNNWKSHSFTSVLKDGSFVPLRVEISGTPHAMFPNTFNLSFGPVNSMGDIDDSAELAHKNYSKVFSSVLLTGLFYLLEHPDQNLGIDGSDEARAYLYHRYIQQNFIYLDQFFEMYAVKYFVRIGRYKKRPYDNPFDFREIIPASERIEAGMELTSSLMYNYFLFKTKNIDASTIDQLKTISNFRYDRRDLQKVPGV